LAENGWYEILCINTAEEDMVSDLELLDSVTNDDDSSQQSFLGNFEVEDADDSDDGEPNANEKQVAMTNDFLSEKISFPDFHSKS
jgi:hypothetical protein